MTATNFRQIVFIDPRVQDIGDLLSGVQPGEQVFVLDPNSDGLQQIADILAANNLTDLSSISIVGHGAAGEMQLGSTMITDGSLADHAGVLAEIGAALSSTDATIQLYGCDVAAGASGQQFLDDFSILTGGATVEAATHLIGDAADGGSFTLDAAATAGTATTTVSTAATPFTTNAVNNFQGTLAIPLSAQLYFRINQGNDVQLGDINADGTNRHTIYYGGGNTTTTVPGGTGNETSIAVDTAAGLVFDVGIGNTGSYDAFSVHNLYTGALISTTEFGANTGSALTDDVVQALAINTSTRTLYVGDWGIDNDTTGIREFTYDLSGNLTPVAGGFLFTATQTESSPGDAATTNFTNANALFVDTQHQLLYYVDDDNGYNFSPFHATNGVYVVSIAAGSAFQPTELTSNGTGTGEFPTADQAGSSTFVGSHGNLVGLAVDVADGIVYFESTDTPGSPNNALWFVTTAGGLNQTAQKMTLPAGVTLAFAGQSSEGGDAAGLIFDPQNRQLYLTNAENSTTTPNTGAIYVLQLDSTGTNITSLVQTFDTATLVGTTPALVNSFDAPSTTFLDLLPQLTVSGTAASPVEQSAAVSLLTGTPTVTDTDGTHLASATVQITGGTFSSNETSANDDHLSVLDGVTSKTSGTFTGTSIAINYDTATETLTLSGYDTLADYANVLSHVQYSTTGDNPTNYGSNTTRTLTWQVNDGAVGNPSGTNTATTTITITAVNDPPTLAGIPTSATVSVSNTVILAPNVTVTDPDDLNLASATVSISGGSGDVLSAAASGNITVNYDGTNEILTLSGNDTLANYQAVLDTVAFEATSSNGTRVVDWVLNDGGASNNLSAVQSETLTLVPCYCRGTLIRTKRGQKRVEKLKIGDRVMTMSGVARPIKWIGRRSYSGRFALGQKHILPICFKAGSIADSVPRRDLWISPHHAMYLEGVLIEARDLINGISVVQAEKVDKIEYFHIELDTHDVIIAEGAFSESFIDDDNRGMFHNAQVFYATFGNQPHALAQYCAPRRDEGYEVEAVRRRLNLRAGLCLESEAPCSLRGYVDALQPELIAGWAQNADHPEAPVCLDIFVDGRLIGQTLANRYREDLRQAGLGSGRHAFKFTPPAMLYLDKVAVRRSLDGVPLKLSFEAKRDLARNASRPRPERVLRFRSKSSRGDACTETLRPTTSRFG